MQDLFALIQGLARDEDGATMVEYGLLIAFIALVAVLGAAILGNGLSTIYNAVGTAVSGVTVPALPTS